MKVKKHGLSIGIERVEQNFFLSMQIVGKLTHEDYEIITPLIDSALTQVKDPKVNAFIDATELEGWDLRAAWDDFKIGLKYNNEFNKIAIYGSKKWQQYAAKIGTWFISGEVKYFDNPEDAMEWLKPSV
ncbi:STAS/SEC14 domain-containing protein [Aliiglaciecola sp. 2_MG-2023]|uniref:STAS/SEC14 domain-containing protein n=2 Tax=Alteromonadales TaxID=135622 RepID=UPI0026E42F0A|nr:MULTISPECIES: STAS/SEC14 domain-containing protein [unclassified Aliiglaciecola]MDO6712842.1 STAS/SEC14 domain-containing protein [Aliiglaciecola sp. 2_MG-2023]MDO6753937.1 STAS/SEC14 domain-containing protein [Aliiglaciecola sp. 1_MG-2023]